MGMEEVAAVVNPKVCWNLIVIVHLLKCEQLGFAGGAHVGADVHFVLANSCDRAAPVIGVLVVVVSASASFGVPVGLQCADFGCGCNTIALFRTVSISVVGLICIKNTIVVRVGVDLVQETVTICGEREIYGLLVGKTKKKEKQKQKQKRRRKKKKEKRRRGEEEKRKREKEKKKKRKREKEKK